MSFHVQPAPRMATAPIANSTRSFKSGKLAPEASAASPVDHQQGNSKSHEPIGRSSRASCR